MSGKDDGRIDISDRLYHLSGECEGGVVSKLSTISTSNGGGGGGARGSGS